MSLKKLKIAISLRESTDNKYQFSELDQVKKNQGLVSQSQNILLCTFFPP